MKLDQPQLQEATLPVINAAALRRSKAPIHWPSPPFGSYPGPAEHHHPMDCMVQGLNGSIARASLIAIDFEARCAELRYGAGKPPITQRFDQFLSLTLAKPLAPHARAARSGSREASAVIEQRPRVPYRVQLRNAKPIAGKTIGYLERHGGLFLFPPVDDSDRVIRTFVPQEACVKKELGTPIGQMLVEQQAISPEQVEHVAARQEELRAQKVGELLVIQQIVTPEDLLKALELQASRPVMRVGEALIALGLIREEQLQAVLQVQKNDRSVPLGELLVRQNLISREDLRSALARKMGYPIVDVTRFPVEVDALRRIPLAVALRLRALPLVLSENALVVGLEDVTRHAILDELEFIAQTKVVPALVVAPDLEGAVRAAYAQLGLAAIETVGADGLPGAQGPAIEDVGKLAETLERDGPAAHGNEEAQIEQSDNSLVRLINQMIIEAHAEGASDIHVECSPGREKVRIRFRKDGLLRPYLELPSSYRTALVSRLKVMCDLDISERRKPQDGKINFARFSPQHKLELRVATIPTSNGVEDVVLRLLASARPVSLAELGLSPGNLAGLRALVERPYGLVLCVGPTGSGKTTTLHSALGHINKPERKIWTAEDPVEITQPGLRQVQVNPKIDWTFARALRAFLRADPDVIMVGEVRDQETAHIVVEASLTGHLVLSTLHTNSAPETVTRLLDMGLDTFNFSDALLGVLAQRLVRALCPKCRVAQPAARDTVDELHADFLKAMPEGARGATPESLLADWNLRFAKDGSLQSYHAPGCAHCSGSGYKGRLGIHELMVNDRELRHLIQKRATPTEIRDCALRSGMRTLRQDGIERVLQGLTTIEEVRANSAEA